VPKIRILWIVREVALYTCHTSYFVCAGGPCHILRSKPFPKAIGLGVCGGPATTRPPHPSWWLYEGDAKAACLVSLCFAVGFSLACGLQPQLPWRLPPALLPSKFRLPGSIGIPFTWGLVFPVRISRGAIDSVVPGLTLVGRALALGKTYARYICGVSELLAHARILNP
jgi:hypothetical protein